MKRLILLFMSMAMTSYVHAYTGFGICNFGKETVPSVICYGPTVLKETTVTGNVKIAGPLKASNVSAGSMIITGAATLQDSTIKGVVEVTGYLEATGVDFNQDIKVTSDNIMLNKSSVKGSLIVDSQTTKPYLKMQCGTRIEGSVTFNGMAGVIQITDDSIVQGKIVNGSMEFVKVNCN